MCNKRISVYIDVKITDIIVTRQTCAFLINEIIKYLVYQKSQIPYPYNWLQNVINRRRKSIDSDSARKYNISVERHFNVVSSAYDAIEHIMNNIKTEFKKCTGFIKEILILFGATLYTPKEVFRIKIPAIEDNHIEANHLNSMQKNQQKILRHIFLSQDWQKAMDHVCPTTNTYILLLKGKQEVTSEENFLVPIQNYSIPTSSVCVTINLDYQNENDHICCSNISVYNDSSCTSYCKSNEDFKTSNSTEDCWYQAKLFVKGYKDCFINKVSATELF